MQLYPAIVSIYQELYRQATLRPNFDYKPGSADRVLICKFIKWLRSAYDKHNINETLLIQFFEFGFSRYSGINTRFGKNSIMINWLIGPKAIKAWQERSVSKKYLIKWRINKDFRIKLKSAFQQVKVNNTSYLLGVNQYEENEKRRFYNQPEGYLYCGQMTTLYNPKSDLCVECEFKTECLERLKISFSKLYKSRMQHGPSIV